MPLCPPGMLAFFQPFVKELPNGAKVCHINITHQKPYQKFSFEEIRLADYVAAEPEYFRIPASLSESNQPSLRPSSLDTETALLLTRFMTNRRRSTLNPQSP
jgi:hypothetical protein